MLFNRKETKGVKVLDLFAGSGTVGFEFISRGASEVIAVDSDDACIRFIRKKAEELNVPRLKPLRSDAMLYLARCGRSFDIVFCDPPFTRENLHELPDAVFGYGILAKDGLLILEHEDIHSFAGHPRFLEDRRYGRVKFSFFG